MTVMVMTVVMARMTIMIGADSISINLQINNQGVFENNIKYGTTIDGNVNGQDGVFVNNASVNTDGYLEVTY